MKFERTKVFNFENAFFGMRAPLESWSKSDSWFGIDSLFDPHEYDLDILENWKEKDYPNGFSSTQDEDAKKKKKLEWLNNNGVLSPLEYSDTAEFSDVAYLGPNDLDLAQRLIKAGPEHRKFLRQIFVSVYMTAPLELLKEMDTYKVGVTCNSTSTMHKIQSKPITLDCFELEDYPTNTEAKLLSDRDQWFTESEILNFMEPTIDKCEDLRQAYIETKDKRYWKMLIQLLPESWLQSRMYTLNYEVIRSIVRQRKNHRLVEWKAFIDWAHTLPYAEELIFYAND